MERFFVEYYIKIMGCCCFYTGYYAQTRLLINISAYFYRTKVCNMWVMVLTHGLHVLGEENLSYHAV